jgi:hypothetical protein
LARPEMAIALALIMFHRLYCDSQSCKVKKA